MVSPTEYNTISLTDYNKVQKQKKSIGNVGKYTKKTT